MKRTGRFLLLCCGLLLAAIPAWAANGHLLHGIGAVHSAMGGAGVALPHSALGALQGNPALLAGLEGHRFEFSAEYVTAKNAVSSSVGPFAGRTEETGDSSVIPAFGWTRHASGSRFALGMGFLGLAGFGVDYPQDPANPILAPQPQGFGRVYSSYQLMKIPMALAWQATPDLALGVSFNAGRATLESDPAGFAAPDCSGPATCYVPRVGNDAAFGYGAQVGLLYRLSQTLSLGASYATKLDFESFEWNSQVADPGLPTFGTARRVEFDLDAPATFAVGLGLTPSPRLSVALDAKWVNYEDADGFGGFGFDPATGQLTGLGWEDILVYAVGVELRPTSRLALRAGYNRGENPIPDGLAFVSVVAPAVFEDHGTLGLGLKVLPGLELDLAYYKAFENEGSGPFLSPFGPVPGTQVSNEMSLDSALATFSFRL